MRQLFVDKKNLTPLLTLMFWVVFVGIASGANTKPTITGLDITSGPSLGGTPVLISGTNFATGLTVDFNGVSAYVDTSTTTTITVTTPLSAKGLAYVRVTNPNGDWVKLNNAFEFIHPGDGVFEYGTDVTPAKIMPEDAGASMDAEAGDIDGDGDLDYVVADETSGMNSVRLYENDGSANFTDISGNVPSAPDSPTGITLGDLNGDNHLDIIVVGYNSRHFYLNNKDNVVGNFSNETANLPQEFTNAWGVDMGDFNNDGHLDIYIANYGSDNLYLNDGNGTDNPPSPPTFTNASDTLPTNSDNSEDCIVADVNGDGWDDIFITNYYSNNTLYLNNKTIDPISFTKTTFIEPPDDNGDVWYGSRDAVIVDLDKDNDLDIVVANHNYNQNRIYLNDGNLIPNFTDKTATSLPQIWDNSHDVKAGDVDGDGDIDLVFANQNIWLDPVNPNPATVTNNNSLYLNNGDNPPTFSYATATHMPAAGSLEIQSWDVILDDLDNDDDLDIIFTNSGPVMAGKRQDQLYLNTP